MKTISQRELRNGSAAIMDAVEGGQAFLITRHGVEVAELRPVPASSFTSLAEVKAALVGLPASDHRRMRAEADDLFGGDRVGD